MIFDRLAQGALRADVSWSPIDDRWYRPDPSSAGFAGFPVSPDTAHRVSAVFACNSLIAETLAATPCLLYRRLENGGKERARDHRLYRTIRQQPNSWMTAVDFFGFGQGHLGLRGNVVNEIRDFGDHVELVPHHPSLTTIEQLATGRMRYKVRDPKTGQERTLLQDEVLHVRDLPMDGYTGEARARLAREAISVAAAGEAFVGGFFKNDATGRVVLSHPGPVVPPKDQRDQFKQDLRSQYSGYRNRGIPMVLYGGMKAEELGKHDDGGFIIDPRKFQVADIARFWRVPLFMIGLEEKSTSWGTGVEQQKQGFVDFTMRAWFTRWQQALARDLLTADEQEEFFFEFLLQDLLRGDLKSRSESLALQKDHGVISPNEWRIIESMNPRDGGDEYQETPQGASPNRAVQGRGLPPAAQDDDEDQARRPMTPLLLDAAARIAAAEAREVSAHGARAKEDGPRFAAWVRGYYGDHARAYATRALAPIAEAFSLDPMVVELTTDRLARSALEVLGAGGVPDGWAEARAAEVGRIIQDTFQAAARFRPAA